MEEKAKLQKRDRNVHQSHLFLLPEEMMRIVEKKRWRRGEKVRNCDEGEEEEEEEDDAAGRDNARSQDTSSAAEVRRGEDR